jgi:hypothetical protein
MIFLREDTPSDRFIEIFFNKYKHQPKRGIINSSLFNIKIGRFIYAARNIVSHADWCLEITILCELMSGPFVS